LRITERQLEKIFSDKRYWRDVWLEVVAESDRENRLQIREARRQGSWAASPLSGVPDSTIAGASALPVNELRQRLIRAAEDNIDKPANHPGRSCASAHPGQSHSDYVDDMDDEEGEEERGKIPTFDSAFEIQTIKPNRKVRFKRPEIRSADQTQRYVADSLSLERGATEAAAIRQLLNKWNAGKESRPEPVRKIVIQRKTLEKRR